jgi:hypothetical protein
MTRTILALLFLATAVTAAAGQSFTVPLSTRDGWETIRPSNRAGHEVRFSDAGLVVSVRQSAGSLAYALPSITTVTRVRARGRVTGTLDVEPARQGLDGHDDFVLRLGLVEAGERRLNFLQRRFAPGWVRRLFELAPPDAGISRVHFLAVGADQTVIGRSRQHPLHELLLETVVTALSPDGTFEIDATLEMPARAVGIWILADGDDTRSAFTLVLEQVVLDGRSGAGSEQPVERDREGAGVDPARPRVDLDAPALQVHEPGFVRAGMDVGHGLFSKFGQGVGGRDDLDAEFRR